jgi:hypothetical protein
VVRPRFSAVDYLGMWKYTVHILKTIDWAREGGFSTTYANIMGASDNGVDNLLSGHSFLPSWLGGEQERHMYYLKGGIDSRDWWFNSEFELARKLLDEADRTHIRTRNA